jgi:hypothetical protein
MPAIRTSSSAASPFSEVAELASSNWRETPVPSFTSQVMSNTTTPRKPSDRGIVVADGGHFGTESPVVADLCRRLEQAAEEQQWHITCETDPTSKDMLHYM